MLRVTGLRVVLGGHEVLHGIDLEVAAGETVALFGANGAGRSTLLRAICGLVDAAAGRVELAGRTMAGLDVHERVRAGMTYVPAERRLFAGMTVRENLSLGAYPVRAAPTSYDEVFDLFPRLAERQGQRAGTLSGGEQQMLALGRALMAAPSLLLLDEPSTGLAPGLATEVELALGRLRDERGTSLLVTEPRASAASRQADRAHVLADGRIRRRDVVDGPPGEHLVPGGGPGSR